MDFTWHFSNEKFCIQEYLTILEYLLTCQTSYLGLYFISAIMKVQNSSVPIIQVNTICQKL